MAGHGSGYNGLVDEVQRICEWLLVAAHARSVWVRDAEGHVLGFAGEVLRAGERVELLEASVAGVTLAVLFDVGASSLGLVRLRMRKACDDLVKALEPAPDDEGGSGAPVSPRASRTRNRRDSR